MIQQTEIILEGYRRGYHIITEKIENAFKELPRVGMLNILVKHTSAGITINENADPSVRQDFSSFIDKLIPENDSSFSHTLEGADDMPAHLKASIIGQSITLPITDGCLNLGTWQGLYFCEFRNFGGKRRLLLTLYS